jgi:hypothetical protein
MTVLIRVKYMLVHVLVKSIILHCLLVTARKTDIFGWLLKRFRFPIDPSFVISDIVLPKILLRNGINGKIGQLA